MTAAFNSSMQWFDVLAPGIVSWATRGVNLGYHRNYFGVQVDDVFLPDSRWSATGHCTPGDSCVDPTVTTTDIRMVPTDVTRLVNWQTARQLPQADDGVQRRGAARRRRPRRATTPTR